MSFPFKVIRGGKSDIPPAPKEFARFDNRRATIDRLKAEILVNNDKYLLKKRNQARLK